jgi:hypothetical protein
MKVLLKVLLLSGVLVICTSAFCGAVDSIRIKGLIAQLGDVDNSVNFKILDSLKECPDKYWLCGLLITELDTASESAYEVGKNALGHYKFEGLHVIWCWRALRMITSLDFFGKTKQTLDGVYEEYLLNKETGKVKYCHVWISRSIVYMAPGDAQLDIINQWKDWYKNEANNYSYKTMNYISTVDF